MSNTSVLETATYLADVNPNAAKLLLNLSNSETGKDLANALDSYDMEMSELLTSV
jgi:hypothetical protein